MAILIVITNSLTKHLSKSRCAILKKVRQECSPSVPVQGQGSTVQENSTCGEYIETMENMPSPVKKEDLTAEANLEEVVNNEYVETTDNTPTTSHIKEEDQDTKELLNGFHLVTNGMQVTEEMLDNDNKFVTTSIITIFSPIIEVEGKAGTDHVTKSKDSVITETGTQFSCEELLYLVTRFPSLQSHRKSLDTVG